MNPEMNGMFYVTMPIRLKNILAAGIKDPFLIITKIVFLGGYLISFFPHDKPK